MGTRKKTLTEKFSYTTIGVSLALMSGLALGHVTEQSMHAQLSAPLPADPVERYALGQNAYKMPHVPVQTSPAQTFEFADASHEIGRYAEGARILTPAEPARKIDRFRMERLQAWNDENFGADGDNYGERAGYGETYQADYAPIDVGAVVDAPEASVTYAVQHTGLDDSSL